MDSTITIFYTIYLAMLQFPGVLIFAWQNIRLMFRKTTTDILDPETNYNFYGCGQSDLCLINNHRKFFFHLHQHWRIFQKLCSNIIGVKTISFHEGPITSSSDFGLELRYNLKYLNL